MAIGRVGSFATDTPLQTNYVGNALTDTENQGFKYRAERKLIADAKKKEEEDKQKIIADDFDKRVKYASLEIPNIALKKYDVTFSFTDVKI